MGNETKYETVDDVLKAYSQGQLTEAEAIKIARLDDYSELVSLILISDYPMRSKLTPHEDQLASELSSALTKKAP